MEARECRARAQVRPRERRAERLEHIDTCVRQRGAGHAAQQREQDALGEGLADDTPASGAERDSDRDLALPRSRPGEQQIRDVGTSDEKHERHGHRQDLQRGLDRRADFVLHTRELEAWWRRRCACI